LKLDVLTELLKGKINFHRKWIGYVTYSVESARETFNQVGEEKI